MSLGPHLQRSRCPSTLEVGTFTVDVTPLVGSQLAYNVMEKAGNSLWLKGMVFVTDDKPVVIAAVDWIGIGGEGNRQFREAIAQAVGTTTERVAIHTLHQHDAPRLDWGAEELLAQQDLSGTMFNVPFAKEVIGRTAKAAQEAVARAQPVTQIGWVRPRSKKSLPIGGFWTPTVRSTACVHRHCRSQNPRFPDGTIDPYVKSISFYNGDKLICVLTYYATHPQSYYRTGLAETDFPGIARILREDALGVPHVHFNGAGGNIGAGKYNDGAHDNRIRLAGRLAKGMQQAYEATEKFPVTAETFGWESVPVSLPPAEHLDEEKLQALIQDESANMRQRAAAATKLSFLRRTQAGETIDIACLKLGQARVLHMPGELFVEYQLNAAKLRPDLFVAMAAYGDYAPGYIGTKIAYTQGGYETSERASKTAPEVEEVLMGAVKKLLGVK